MTAMKYVLFETPWVVIGAILGKVAKSYAYTTRGYETVGSEIFILPMVAGLGMYITFKIMGYLYWKEDEEDYEYDD